MDARKELVPKRPCFSFGLNMAFINQQKFWMHNTTFWANRVPFGESKVGSGAQ